MNNSCYHCSFRIIDDNNTIILKGNLSVFNSSMCPHACSVDGRNAVSLKAHTQCFFRCSRTNAYVISILLILRKRWCMKNAFTHDYYSSERTTLHQYFHSFSISDIRYVIFYALLHFYKHWPVHFLTQGDSFRESSMQIVIGSFSISTLKSDT